MNIAYRLVKIADKIVTFIVYTLLILIFLFCLYALFDTLKLYSNASTNNLSLYKPDESDPSASLKALLKINPDVVGWITIDDTKIDYPIVIGESNDEYLDKDVYGNFSLSGSIFLDYAADRNFSDLFSVMYGHHMNGGYMFGDIQKFVDESYFNSHNSGRIYTVDGRIYDIEIYAFIQTDSYDGMVYAVNHIDQIRQSNKIMYLTENAKYIKKNISINPKTKLMALSTCSKATTNGRDVLVVKLNERESGVSEKESN